MCFSICHVSLTSSTKEEGKVPKKSKNVPDKKEDVPFDDTDAKLTGSLAQVPKEGKKKKGLKQGNEALLFGDTGDIFADLPSLASATTKKKVTKKKGGAKKITSQTAASKQQKEDPVPAANVPADGELPFGDVEATTVEPVPKKTTTKKKKVIKKKAQAATKDFDIFDTNTPSIFDNPTV
jgi:hypothetical protein